MRQRICLLSTLILVVAASCGGGSGPSDGGIGGGGGETGILAGSFSPDQPTPGTETVSLSEGSGGSGNLVVVRVDVTGTLNVFGAAFDVMFDPDSAEFVNWQAGDLLESGGQSVSYQLSATQPGRIVVGISRNDGQSGGVDADGSRALVLLTFRVLQTGTSAVTFQNARLFDAQSPPQSISGLSWFGGTLVAN